MVDVYQTSVEHRSNPFHVIGTYHILRPTYLNRRDSREEKSRVQFYIKVIST